MPLLMKLFGRSILLKLLMPSTKNSFTSCFFTYVQQKGSLRGVIGGDMIVLEKRDSIVNIVGIQSHEVTDVPT